MGLDKARSLLKVTCEVTCLDLIAKQMASMLMNSFSMPKDTVEAFAKYRPRKPGEN